MTVSTSVKSPAGSRSPEADAYVVTSRNDLRAALARPRVVHRELIGTLLTATGHLTENGLRAALAAQDQSPGSRLGELLLSTDKITDDDLCRALSAQFAVPYVRLGGFDVDAEALARIPQEIIRANCVLPLMQHQGHLVVAMRDPSNSDVMRTLSVAAGLSIIPVLATPDDIHVAIAIHCPPFDDAALLAEAEHLGRDHGDAQEQMSAERLAQQQPIVRLVSNMLHDAIQRCASDIHIRPREHRAQILYRIDGSLIRIREFSRDLLPVIAARVKVIAGMDVAEHRLP